MNESTPHCPSCLCFEPDRDSLICVRLSDDSFEDYNQAFPVRPLAHVPKDMGAEMGIYGPDPNLDKIEECGPYLLCIRPPGSSRLTNDDNYIIRLYHKDSKEVVIADSDDPPVKVYSYYYSNNCNSPTLLAGGVSWWCCASSFPFHIRYNGRLVCRWGGEKVAKELPYERGQQSLM